LRRTSPGRIDAVLATCFVVAGLATTSRSDPIYTPRDGIAVALIFLATVPYYVRRRAPLAVFAISVVAVATLFVLEYAAGALPMAIAIGAYTVGAYCPARKVVVAAVLMNIAFIVMVVTGSPDFGRPEYLTSVAAYGAVMLVGWSMQSRRLRLDALEREQGEAALRAAADERLRIAQELHDVVAHSLGVIAVQAGVGMHMIGTDPAAARRALEHISRSSRTSLAEIRRTLGLVRAGETSPTYEPAPGLADLARLANEVAGAGLCVDLTIDAGATAIPPGVELTAYRIVQEALTNAVRHGHARHAVVKLATDARNLHVHVSDDGTGTNGNTASGGHGLVGMRERVAVYGGSLAVGPGPTGGFTVDATVPYDEDGSA
jgi:signal transduction histidine kinase